MLYISIICSEDAKNPTRCLTNTVFSWLKKHSSRKDLRYTQATVFDLSLLKNAITYEQPPNILRCLGRGFVEKNIS